MAESRGDARNKHGGNGGAASQVFNASGNASRNVMAQHIETVNYYNTPKEDGQDNTSSEEQTPSLIEYPEFRLCPDCCDVVRTDIGENGDFITEKEEESFEDEDYDVESKLEKALRNMQPNTEASLAALSTRAPPQPFGSSAQDVAHSVPHTHPPASSSTGSSSSPLSASASTPNFLRNGVCGIAMGRVLLERGQHYWEVAASMTCHWEYFQSLCEVGVLGPGEDLNAFIGLSSSKMGFGVEFVSCRKHQDLCVLAFARIKQVSHTSTGLHPSRDAQVTMRVGLLLNIEQGTLVILNASAGTPLCIMHRLKPPLTPSFSITFVGHVHLRLMTGDKTSVDRRKLQRL